MKNDQHKKAQEWCRKVLASTRALEKSDEEAAAKETEKPTIHHRQSLTEVMRNAAAAVADYNRAKASKRGNS